MVRHHRQPRLRLFRPDDLDCPIPLKYIDVQRITETDLDDLVERRIDDIWCASCDIKKLSAPWVGKTIFSLLRPAPPPGHKWISGRLTRLQSTTRPENLWPEAWRSMSQSQKRKAIEEWELESRRLDAARKDRGVLDIPPSEVDDYNRIMAEARGNFPFRKPLQCQLSS